MQKSIFGYAKSYSRSHDAVIRVYDESGNVLETPSKRAISKTRFRRGILNGAKLRRSTANY
jgi:hypothetical protein